MLHHLWLVLLLTLAQASSITEQLHALQNRLTQPSQGLLNELDALLKETTDTQILSQIYFNKGIVELALGRDLKSLANFKQVGSESKYYKISQQKVADINTRYGVGMETPHCTTLECYEELLEVSPYSYELLDGAVELLLAAEEKSPYTLIKLLTTLTARHPTKDLNNFALLAQLQLHSDSSTAAASVTLKKCLSYDMDQRQCIKQMKLINKIRVADPDTFAKKWDWYMSSDGDAKPGNLKYDVIIKKLGKERSLVDQSCKDFHSQFHLESTLCPTVDKILGDCYYELGQKKMASKYAHDDYPVAWMLKLEHGDHSVLEKFGENFHHEPLYRKIVERRRQQEHEQRQRQQEQFRRQQQQQQQQQERQAGIDSSKDYYKIMGVSKDASKKDVRKAYLQMTKIHHPDKGGSEAEIMEEINEAYEVLYDDEKRKEYDAIRAGGGGRHHQGHHQGFQQGFHQGQQFGGFGGFNEQQFRQHFGGFNMKF